MNEVFFFASNQILKIFQKYQKVDAFDDINETELDRDLS